MIKLHKRFAKVIYTLPDLGLLLLFVLFLSSCEPDPDSPYFAGPSEISVEFVSGLLQGLQFNLASNASGNDHEYRSLQNINKVYINSLKGIGQDSILAASFINWAWVGSHDSGIFLTVFANDPSVMKSGDLQIIKINGDEYIASIPSSIDCQITDYNPDFIQGEMEFMTKVDYKIQNISKRTDAVIRISFKLVRGPDL